MYGCKGWQIWLLVPITLLTAVLFTGCEPALEDKPGELLVPDRGKQNIAQAIAALSLHRQSVKPLRAGGNCRIEWYENGKKHDENPAIQLRLYPPDRLYFSGDILGGEAIRLGTNAEDFWFRIKPKEVSSYWWGKRATAKRCPTGNFLSPETILEALGMVDVNPTWGFIGRNGYDILTLHAPDGVPVKRIHVDWSDYLVKKIEYFDAMGLVTVIVKMSEYTDGADGTVVPARIGIVHLGSGEGGIAIDMTLRDIKPFSPTPAQLEGKLFARPDTKGFENIYVLNDNCEFVPEEP